MPVDKLNESIKNELQKLAGDGILKTPERVITGYIPAVENYGPRFLLEGEDDKKFLRMNSNNYLGLAQHSKLIDAEKEASDELGINAGAVRFIDGTTKYHIKLEEKLADFHNKQAAKIFSSAYMANLGVIITLTNKKTYIISDELNHNSIVRAIRIAGVPSENKGIYLHNDIDGLKKSLDNVPGGIERVIIIFDGVFSMRGDYAPVKEIAALGAEYSERFKDGVITIIDDSHGTAAFGETGRGTPEVAGEFGVDVITSTLGKAFGAEGGYAVSSKEIIELVRQRADTYIYSNPVSPGAANAGIAAVSIVNSGDGRNILARLRENSEYFRQGIESIGYETIPGIHPITPVLIRDTDKVKIMVQKLYERGILVTGLTFPVVPRGSETIRIQISAAHTKEDLSAVIAEFKNISLIK
ncbi:aminotransferase class I/II-fold pyridoxal phosphate-dependent enzyme [bacterium]|nr:aminotransferase class I/II-fold pyridoxal phosphate-dependent enzyme [bacterium]